MIVGFTGTRSGMSEAQDKEIRLLLVTALSQAKLINDIDVITGLHGGCVGADMDFHNLMVEEKERFTIEVYPGHSSGNPSNLKFRGSYEDEADIIHESQTHFKRNRDIVDKCDVLIATPYTDHETGGGTWYTINYARKIGKKVIVLKR